VPNESTPPETIEEEIAFLRKIAHSYNYNRKDEAKARIVSSLAFPENQRMMRAIICMAITSMDTESVSLVIDKIGNIHIPELGNIHLLELTREHYLQMHKQLQDKFQIDLRKLPPLHKTKKSTIFCKLVRLLNDESVAKDDFTLFLFRTILARFITYLPKEAILEYPDELPEDGPKYNIFHYLATRPPSSKVKVVGNNNIHLAQLILDNQPDSRKALNFRERLNKFPGGEPLLPVQMAVLFRNYPLATTMLNNGGEIKISDLPFFAKYARSHYLFSIILARMIPDLEPLKPSHFNIESLWPKEFWTNIAQQACEGGNIDLLGMLYYIHTKNKLLDTLDPKPIQEAVSRCLTDQNIHKSYKEATLEWALLVKGVEAIPEAAQDRSIVSTLKKGPHHIIGFCEWYYELCFIRDAEKLTIEEKNRLCRIYPYHLPQKTLINTLSAIVTTLSGQEEITQNDKNLLSILKKRLESLNRLHTSSLSKIDQLEAENLPQDDPNIHTLRSILHDQEPTLYLPEPLLVLFNKLLNKLVPNAQPKKTEVRYKIPITRQFNVTFLMCGKFSTYQEPGLMLEAYIKFNQALYRLLVNVSHHLLKENAEYESSLPLEIWENIYSSTLDRQNTADLRKILQNMGLSSPFAREVVIVNIRKLLGKPTTTMPPEQLLDSLNSGLKKQTTPPMDKHIVVESFMDRGSPEGHYCHTLGMPHDLSRTKACKALLYVENCLLDDRKRNPFPVVEEESACAAAQAPETKKIHHCDKKARSLPPPPPPPPPPPDPDLKTPYASQHPSRRSAAGK